MNRAFCWIIPSRNRTIRARYISWYSGICPSTSFFGTCCSLSVATSPSFGFSSVVAMFSVVLLSFVALATTVVGQTHYKHGPTFGWRRGGKGYIVTAETTLKPGPPPNPQVPRLAVWPGMDTALGLIQPIIVSTSQKEYPYVLQDSLAFKRNTYQHEGLACCRTSSWSYANDASNRACKAGPTQWCVFASYLQYPSSQKMGKQAAMNGDDKLKMTCSLHLAWLVKYRD